MNPITSTVAASCNRLVVSPRSSPRNSPRNSPVAGRKSPFLDLPEERKRRDSKEILQYKKMLADSTSQAYRAKRIENRNSGVNAGIGNAHCPEGLLMELENDLSETVDQALLTAFT